MKKFWLVPFAMLLSTPAFAAQVSVIESYDASIGELPEGVAVAPSGDIYVTLAGTGEMRHVDRRTYEGESFASFDIGNGFLLGMAFRGNDLYVALASFVDSTSGVWRVYPNGSKTRVVAFGANEFPNDITFDTWGNMYVTESISGSVYKVEPGLFGWKQRELWFQDPLLVGDVTRSPVPFPIGANGLAYDDQAHSLIVVNSQNPRVIEIEDCWGHPGEVNVVAEGEHLRGADGVSIDRNGDLIVVSNYYSTIYQVERCSGDAYPLADASDGLVFPSTVAFGQFGNDKKSLFIANFGFGAGPDAAVGLLKLKYGVKSELFPTGR